ncbi:MAG: hypothetical protein ACI8RD_004393 [Bacillariaceae sp.]|jgi:hypothetical protein
MNGISVFLFALLYYYHCDGDDDGRWTMDDGLIYIIVENWVLSKNCKCGLTFVFHLFAAKWCIVLVVIVVVPTYHKYDSS